VSAYLLDTDIAIELLRGRNVEVAKKLASKSQSDVFLSTVTVSELIFGAYRGRNPGPSVAASRRFYSSFHLVPLNADAAEQVGTIRAHLESEGKRIGAYDLLIAGIALANQQILVTHNTREFGRIPKLQIEDWVERS
jgi:tRNA(fMet)-specific endonuclease VapC